MIELKTFSDARGSLTVIEKVLPFKIKRVFFIYSVNSNRGGHRHKKTWQALICTSGSCVVKINNGVNKESFILDSPEKCLILEPKDWHTMENFSKESVLLVLASEYFDPKDYVEKGYSND